MKADPPDIDSEATPQGASVLSDRSAIGDIHIQSVTVNQCVPRARRNWMSGNSAYWLHRTLDAVAAATEAPIPDSSFLIRPSHPIDFHARRAGS
jgi:hypothetical protein